ncbi:AfsR/SARP family transcriptional regulator [Kitasatospora phosalacinea]|uniref:AfsR/SARP family transcriptional regulator n=1 Tax=Kitasatospora phosalacinea TaxID=2065 RepID=UPI0025543690|nr:BTAD domain-containing putative transcriptional regulator [Kitasatospora phosalacinea]
MRFRLLGALEVNRDGTSFDVPRPRLRAALAFLLLNADRPVGTERLVDALWGEHPPRTARNQVHTVVSTLRQALPPEAAELLRSDPAGYRLAVDPDSVDVRQFARGVAAARALAADGAPVEAARALRTALDLWRGEALAGIDAPFAGPVRTRLAEERFAALELLADAELAAGRHHPLVPELTALLREFPDREGIAARLATALHRSGRPADALAVLRDTRTLLADEYGLDPGRALLDAEAAVLRGEDAAGGATGSAGTVAAAPQPPAPAGPPSDPGPPSYPRPAQLPQASHGFVGRRAELDRLSGLAAGTGPAGTPGDNGPRTALVVGPAGIGKTAFAVRWAHCATATGAFPDGQLFVDLHGYDANECETAPRVLERFLLALGVPGHRIPEDPVLREDLYRSTVAGRRLLVVLDNAQDYEQVRPLLPGTAESFTLVTSRGRLGRLVAQTGAVPLRLGVLPPAEAVAVLAELAGPELVRAAPGAAAELADLCGGLPLALRISAVRLVEEPELPIGELAGELAPEQDRLAGLGLFGDDLTVSGALSHSYRRLAPEQARLFRLVSLHPGASVPAGAAAALLEPAGTPLSAGAPAPARRLLRTLEDVHLLERSAAEPGHYAMHDLVRLYGRQLAAAAGTDCGTEAGAEAAVALDRLAEWYIAHADAAYRILDPKRLRPPTELQLGWSGPEPFADSDGAQQWFVQESDNLLALTRLGVAHGRHRAVWQLALLHFTHLMRSHRLGLLAEVQRLGEEAALALGHRLAAATLANNRGIAYAIRRDRAAAGHLERAIAGYEEIGEHGGAARARLNLGNMHYEFRELERAAHYQEGAVATARATGDDALLYPSLQNLALVRNEQGRHADARDLLVEAVAVSERIGTEHAVADSRVKLAWVLQRLGEHQRAFELCEASLAVARRFGDLLMVGRAIDQMGTARISQGRSAEAREHWEEAIRVFSGIGSVEAETVRRRMAEHFS